MNARSNEPARLLENGNAFLALSALFFGSMAVAVKIVSADFPSAEVAFIRFVGGLVLILAAALSGRAPLRFGRRGLLFVRGILAGIAVLAYFASIERIPVASAVTLNCTYPIFATVLALCLRRERWRWDIGAALVLSFAGVVLVVDPSLGGAREGYLFGLASGVTAGATILVIKDLRATESAQSIFFSFSLLGALCTVPFVRSSWVWPAGPALPLLAAVILLASAGQLLMNHGFKYTTVSRGTILLFPAVVVSSVLGHFLFGDPYGLRFLAGAALILGSSIYVGRKRAEAEEEPVGG